MTQRTKAAARWIPVAALVTALTAMPTNAQEAATSRERGSLQFGAFVSHRDTTTRLDSASGFGTQINLEEDLGLESSLAVFRLNGDVWVGDRHRFDLSVFDLSRSASRAIDETIVFGDETFVIDTTVFTQNDLTILKSDYTYALVNRSRGYFGPTAGLYVASTKLSLSEATLGTAESEDLTAPLPVLGFRGDYDLTDRIALIGYAQWFSIDTGDVSGKLRDIYIGTDFRLNNRWAIGLAYNEVAMRIDAKESDGLTGELDWGYDGWIVYARLRFGS